jgi:hypothetical protein
VLSDREWLNRKMRAGQKFCLALRVLNRPGGDSSFLKKRSKRLLLFQRLHRGGHGLDPAAGAGIKVFWLFSSEKKIPSCDIGQRDFLFL